MIKLINKKIFYYKNYKDILKRYFIIWISKKPENLEETVVNKVTNKRIISLVKEKRDKNEDEDNKEKENEKDNNELTKPEFEIVKQKDEEKNELSSSSESKVEIIKKISNSKKVK